MIHTHHIWGVFPGSSAHNVHSYFCQVEPVNIACHTWIVSNPVASRMCLFTRSRCGHLNKCIPYLNDFFRYQCDLRLSSERQCVKSEVKTSHMLKASSQYECEHAVFSICVWETVIHASHFKRIHTRLQVCLIILGSFHVKSTDGFHGPPPILLKFGTLVGIV